MPPPLVPLPAVIGHRGAAGSAPENTLAAFRRAAALGTGWVEFDVQLTADGVPVVFHDDRLDRTTDGRGRLDATTAAALRGLDAGSWFSPAFAGERVPTLVEALDCIAGLGLGANIEVKAGEDQGDRVARVALAEALAVWPKDRAPPLVSSFARSALAAARAVVPDWPRGLLDARLAPDWRRQADDLAVATVNLRHDRIDAATMAEVRATGRMVLAYTVNRAGRARALWKMGVAAVFSDRPEAVMPATSA